MMTPRRPSPAERNNTDYWDSIEPVEVEAKALTLVANRFSGSFDLSRLELDEAGSLRRERADMGPARPRPGDRRFFCSFDGADAVVLTLDDMTRRSSLEVGSSGEIPLVGLPHRYRVHDCAAEWGELSLIFSVTRRGTKLAESLPVGEGRRAAAREEMGG